MENDVVERLQEYVRACEVTANGNSKHCQDCRDAIAEIESLRKQFLEGVTTILGKVKEYNEIVKDVEARMDRAGL